MRRQTFTALIVGTCFAVGVSAQRRGLDQMDLLSVPRSTSTAAAESRDLSKIDVNGATFKLFAPLIGHCNKLENEYRTELAGPKTKTAHSYEYFMNKTGAIYRSSYLIRQIQPLPDDVNGVLDDNDRIAEDAAMILATLAYGGGEASKAQFAEIFRRFGLKQTENSESDRAQLVAAMLGRINSNFARLKAGR